MRRALYVLLSTLVFVLLSPVLLLARKTRRGFLERFGVYAAGRVPEGGWPRVWLHGASAGDLQALAPMIARFRERFPDARILLSTITGAPAGPEVLRPASTPRACASDCTRAARST